MSDADPSLMRPLTLRSTVEMLMRDGDERVRIRVGNNLVDAYERMERALRNCLALAVAKQAREGRPGDWSDIERFCESAGIVRTVLR